MSEEQGRHLMWVQLAALAHCITDAREAGVRLPADGIPAGLSGEAGEGPSTYIPRDRPFDEASHAIMVPFCYEDKQAFIWIKDPRRAGSDTQSELDALGRLASTMLGMEISHGIARLLMDEIEHRCGNDLQLMLSTLSFQIGETRNEQVRLALMEARGRIEVLAGSRKALRAGQSDMSFDTLVRSTCHAAAVQAAPRGVLIAVQTEEVQLANLRPASAPRVALALNELLTNALKHGFPGKTRGIVNVSLQRGPGMLEIKVDDDGVPFKTFVKRDGRGLDLVEKLIRSVGGEFILPETDKAFTLRLRTDRL